MFSTGVSTQQDTLLFRDYSSWGTGGFDETTGERLNSAEPEKSKREAKCKANFDDLVRRLGEFERSAELWHQLELAGCDVWLGGNDNVAGVDVKLHPLGLWPGFDSLPESLTHAPNS